MNILSLSAYCKSFLQSFFTKKLSMAAPYTKPTISLKDYIEQTKPKNPYTEMQDKLCNPISSHDIYSPTYKAGVYVNKIDTKKYLKTFQNIVHKKYIYNESDKLKCCEKIIETVYEEYSRRINDHNFTVYVIEGFKLLYWENIKSKVAIFNNVSVLSVTKSLEQNNLNLTYKCPMLEKSEKGNTSDAEKTNGSYNPNHDDLMTAHESMLHGHLKNVKNLKDLHNKIWDNNPRISSTDDFKTKFYTSQARKDENGKFETVKVYFVNKIEFIPHEYTESYIITTTVNKQCTFLNQTFFLYDDNFTDFCTFQSYWFTFQCMNKTPTVKKNILIVDNSSLSKMESYFGIYKFLLYKGQCVIDNEKIGTIIKKKLNYIPLLGWICDPKTFYDNFMTNKDSDQLQRSISHLETVYKQSIIKEFIVQSDLLNNCKSVLRILHKFKTKLAYINSQERLQFTKPHRALLTKLVKGLKINLSKIRESKPKAILEKYLECHEALKTFFNNSNCDSLLYEKVERMLTKIDNKFYDDYKELDTLDKNMGMSLLKDTKKQTLFCCFAKVPKRKDLLIKIAISESIKNKRYSIANLQEYQNKTGIEYTKIAKLPSFIDLSNDLMIKSQIILIGLKEASLNKEQAPMHIKKVFNLLKKSCNIKKNSKVSFLNRDQGMYFILQISVLLTLMENNKDKKAILSSIIIYLNKANLTIDRSVKDNIPALLMEKTKTPLVTYMFNSLEHNLHQKFGVFYGKELYRLYHRCGKWHGFTDRLEHNASSGHVDNSCLCPNTEQTTKSLLLA